MNEQRQFRAIKGVRDILPPDSSLWNWFESTSRRVMESYGYREIRLPIFEETDLFASSVGLATDIVSKEMYTFEDRPAELPDPLGHIRLPDYVEELERALESGGIPDLPSNRQAIERLKQHTVQVFGKVTATLPEVRDPQVFRDVFYAFNLVRTIVLGERISLRPEATASVIRAYIEHGMHVNPGLTKLYYIGPMFRRERPQKGRYRQFYQVGAEVLGQSDAPAIDAELIEMLVVLLGECKIEKWTLLVNSIGCRDCRPKYIEALKNALAGVKEKMCGDCQRRAETNPLRVLDCKVPQDQPLIEKLPSIADHLCEACRSHFAELQRQLKLREIPFTITPRLVRGLDYYMRTTFEITSPVLGAQNALVGGGRYDGLAELLGGQPTKGIGFALGTDRFIDAIREAGTVDASLRVDVFIAWLGGPAAAQVYPVAVRIARRLRAAGLCVELPPEEMKLKKSLGLADKLGARYALLIGENEMAAGKYVLKRLADAQQRELSEGELVEYLLAESRKE